MTEKERKKRENELSSPQKGQRKKRSKLTQEQLNEQMLQLIDAMPKETKKEKPKPTPKETQKKKRKKNPNQRRRQLQLKQIAKQQRNRRN